MDVRFGTKIAQIGHKSWDFLRSVSVHFVLVLNLGPIWPNMKPSMIPLLQTSDIITERPPVKIDIRRTNDLGLFLRFFYFTYEIVKTFCYCVWVTRDLWQESNNKIRKRGRIPRIGYRRKDERLSGLSDMNVRFGPKVEQILPKWDKSGTFSYQLSVYYWIIIMIWKSPVFVQFGPIWPTLGPKSDIPG